MAQFQNSFQNHPIQPMQTYTGYNPQMGQTNPYMDRLQQYNQNIQQQFPSMQSVNQTPIGLIGRAVENQENITFQDVPTNGAFAFFPKNDMSEIYVRALSGEGNVVKMVYKPVDEAQNGQGSINPNEEEKLKIELSEEATEVFMKKFDEITKQLEKMEKTIKPKTTRATKKEVENDE